jgi:diaminopimelate decarboxylase
MPRIKDFPWSEEQIVGMANRFQTPFHLYHEEGIREQVRNLNKAFSWCPGYRNFFAVKATPNPYILQILKEEGCGTDCSSIAEMVLSEKMGFTGEEVMFTSNNTPIKEYAFAKNLGAIVNLDDLSHVEFVHKELGLNDLVSFRYNPGPERTGNVLIGDPKEAKFGTTMSQLLEGYKRCKELGVKRFGLHTMVVSNCLKVEELCETARMLFMLVGTIKEKLGIEIEMVNLGGGFGVPYKPEEEVIDTAAVGAGIHEIYKELIEAKHLAPVRVVTECGRYITGPVGFLVTRVTHRKRIYKNYVGVDACMANLMRPGMYGAYHHITIHRDERPPAGLPSRSSDPADNSADLIIKDKVYDVVGGLCENNDKFAIDRALEPDPRVGDVAVIHDSGAHGHSMGFNYNGKPRSAEYLYRPDGSVLQIRRAETLDDLFATLDMAGAEEFGKEHSSKKARHESVEV